MKTAVQLNLAELFFKQFGLQPGFPNKVERTNKQVYQYVLFPSYKEADKLRKFFFEDNSLILTYNGKNYMIEKFTEIPVPPILPKARGDYKIVLYLEEAGFNLFIIAGTTLVVIPLEIKEMQ